MNAQSSLDWLTSRRSVRAFTAQPVSEETLERLLLAATSAPSSTNRQPWRFAVVTQQQLRANIARAVATRAEEMKSIIRRGHHAEDFGNYADFFHEPLQSATLLIVPQYREYPDLIANLIASGGGDPNAFDTASSMQAELCSTSAACMALLLQVHAEGLGACWMAGPMIARREICQLLDINEPWKMLGMIALGHPAPPLPEKQPRKPLDKVVVRFAEPKQVPNE